MTKEDERDMACTNWICSQNNGTVIKAREVWKAAVKWADQHPTPNWISVEDELPPENDKTQQSINVWATDGLTSGEFRYNFDTKTWTDTFGDPFDITYWMSLPQLPRKEE